MQVVIVYESFFGNTRHVAEAIAEGMHEAASEALVTCVPVTEADAELVRGADLLVVGGPTHRHGMSSSISRRIARRTDSAKEEAGALAVQAKSGLGLRELIRALPRVPWSTRAASFDTRGETRGVGGAAHGIARRLRARGYSLVSRPTGFAVGGLDGPLGDGELERAKAWGAALLGSENLAASG